MPLEEKLVRVLRLVAIFMVILLVFTLLLTGYLFLTASVTIAAFKAEGAQAADMRTEFERIKASVEEESFRGTLFNAQNIGEAEDYVFITYTLRISNQCLVPIDMIEVQVVPETTDVLQLGEDTLHSLGPKSEGDITATILAPKTSHAVRELIVTYYVWGISFTIRETYGG